MRWINSPKQGPVYGCLFILFILTFCVAEGRAFAIKSAEGYLRYVYNEVTGRKVETRTYALSADLEDDVLGLNGNDITRVEYTYDGLGRLHETKTSKRNSATVSPAEVTTTDYDSAGNRDNETKANGVTATYTYDNINRLTNLVHSGSLSSFGYTLQPDGMRQTATEELKYSDNTTKTNNITYSYDYLNRLIGEQATEVEGGYNYNTTYDYDVVGNRTFRTIIANSQTLTTEYQYDNPNKSDQLKIEIHSGPGIVFAPSGDERYYAYAEGGGISYRSQSGKKIGKIAAFMRGLPNEMAHYLLAITLICVPVSFFMPVSLSLRGRRPKQSRLLANRSQGMALWKRCLCVLLAYLMLITPTGFESIANASSQYSQINIGDWATNKYIEYAYDNNGSCTRKTTKNLSESIVEDVAYDYNLRNKLWKVTTDPIQGSTVSVTEYTYNPEGIRVKAYSYDMPRGGGTKSSEKTVSYLIDKGGPNPEAAKKLIDFLLSPRVEEMPANCESGQIPMRAKVTRPAHISALSYVLKS